MFYHISSKAGMRVLKPHISTHKKSYVYALENMVTGLLFGAKQDDFDFLISTDETGNPVVYECYPNAFEKIYKGKSCSVYEVSEKGFIRGMTSWEPELVNENEVEVINEIVIADLYERLLEEEQKGNLKIHRYRHCEEYRKQIAPHIVDRIIRFDIDLHHITEKDERFCEYYKEIVQSLRSIMDGHLLS